MSKTGKLTRAQRELAVKFELNEFASEILSRVALLTNCRLTWPCDKCIQALIEHTGFAQSQSEVAALVLLVQGSRVMLHDKLQDAVSGKMHCSIWNEGG